MSAFGKGLERVLRHEGGFSNHPADKGGATNRGITQSVYDAYRAQMHRPSQSVESITDDEIEAIYFERYWSPAKCIAIESAGRPLLAAVHFDAAVNHGISGAAKLLQRALGVDDDGVIGPATMMAVAQCNEIKVIAKQLDERALYFARIVKNDSSQNVFIEGWLKRVIALRNEFIQPAARAA